MLMVKQTSTETDKPAASTNEVELRPSFEQSECFRQKTSFLDLNIEVIGSEVHTSV